MQEWITCISTFATYSRIFHPCILAVSHFHLPHFQSWSLREIRQVGTYPQKGARLSHVPDNVTRVKIVLYAELNRNTAATEVEAAHSTAIGIACCIAVSIIFVLVLVIDFSSIKQSLRFLCNNLRRCFSSARH